MNVALSESKKIQIANSDQIYSVMQQVLLREEFLGRKQEPLLGNWFSDKLPT